MKKEKAKVLKEKYAGSFEGKKSKKKDDQPGLFGEADQLYNTIQEELSIVDADIKSCQDSIEKKEDQLTDLIARRGKLDRAAASAVKLRDKQLKEKKK